MDPSIRGASGASGNEAKTPANNDTASKETIKPRSRAVHPVSLSELPHFRPTSKGAIARRAELAKPVRMRLLPATGGQPPWPLPYALGPLTKAPLESTGRPTTSDEHWATGFARRAPACAASFVREVGYRGPGFQHDAQHYSGVGRGLGANLYAFCHDLGEPFPGRLGRTGLDFYEAVGYRHDWNYGSDSKPPFVPKTLRDYREQAARNAHFDPFEFAVAKILTAGTAHHESERALAKWYVMLGDAVEQGELNWYEATALVMQCQMLAVVDQSEILCTATSFHEAYCRLSLLPGEWGEHDGEPLDQIEPAISAAMCSPAFYDDVGSAAWHAKYWREGVKDLSKKGRIDRPLLKNKFKLPPVQTIRDRIPTRGPGYRAIYAGCVAVSNAFAADPTLTHGQLIEIGTDAVDANLIRRGAERLAQISAEDPDGAMGLALRLNAMKRTGGGYLSTQRLQMQVSMAAMLGDEAVMSRGFYD